MLPAISTNEKVVTGLHHGDAFSKLNEVEKESDDLVSGFVDYEKLKFVSDDGTIYLKEIILLRHAQADLRKENGSITFIGRMQAFKVASFLKAFQGKGFQGFCSPYTRCQQTSEIIKEISSISFQINDNLSKGNTATEEILDTLPEKSILVTHSDIIQSILMITKFINQNRFISNCSVTYINRNRLIWLAKELEA